MAMLIGVACIPEIAAAIANKLLICNRDTVTESLQWESKYKTACKLNIYSALFSLLRFMR